MTASIAISLVDVVKRYSAGITVGPASLDVRKGEFFSLLGASGSGKTTLLRCIAGFESLTSGAIMLDGRAIHDAPAHRRNVGLVFQSYALFPHKTVSQNIAYGLKLRRVAPAEIAERVRRMLEMVGMPELANRYPSQLSGGQQQRVAIARALVLEPPLVLFDEPLSNLDAKLREQLRIELRSLQRRLNMTCIFVTHDQSEALALSDRIAVLTNGRIAQIGTPTEIYETPADLSVAEFVGSSNRFAVEVTGKDADRTCLRSAGGMEFSSARQQPTAVSRLTALFRPEQVAIRTDSDGSGPNTFRCLVDDVTYLGEDTHLRLVCTRSKETFLATVKSAPQWSRLTAGTPVVAAVDPAAILLFEG